MQMRASDSDGAKNEVQSFEVDVTGNRFFRYDIFGYSHYATQLVSNIYATQLLYAIVVAAAVGSNGINKILW